METRILRSKEGRWKGRPVLAALLRTFVFLSPMAASFVVALVVSRLLPPPAGGMNTVAWWGAVMVSSFAALFLVERVVRRLSPLAILLKLTMTFPDRAPSRYRVARQSGNVRELQVHLAQARELGDDGLAEVASAILSLATALSSHDRLTRGHSERVRTFTDMLADELNVPTEGKERLRWAALLHDVGKLEIPQKVLNKGRRLTAREWGLIKAHPETGMRYLGPLAGWLGEWAITVEQHHERFDGKGYPTGVAGNDISLGARIVAVADAYDTMTSARPYKKPMSPVAAREELSRHAGSQFDPIVVRAMMNVSIGRLWWRVGVVSWFAQLPYIGQLPTVISRALEAATMGALRTAAAAATLGVAGVTAPMARGASLPPGSVVHEAHQTETAGARPHGTPDGPSGGGGVQPRPVTPPVPPPADHPGGGHGGGPRGAGSGGGGSNEVPPTNPPPGGGSGGSETPPPPPPPDSGGSGGGSTPPESPPSGGGSGGGSTPPESPPGGGGGNPGGGGGNPGGGGGNPGGGPPGGGNGGGTGGGGGNRGGGSRGGNPGGGGGNSGGGPPADPPGKGNGNGNAWGPGGNPNGGGNGGGNGNGNGNSGGSGGGPGQSNPPPGNPDPGPPAVPPAGPPAGSPPAVDPGPPGNGNAWGYGGGNGNENAGGANSNAGGNDNAGGNSNAGGNGNGNGSDKTKTK